MPNPNRVKAYARRVLPDIRAARRQVERTLEGLRQESTAEIAESLGPSSTSPADADRATEELTRLLQRGLSALDKVEGDQPLPPAEQSALEAIVLLYARPALLVQNGDFGVLPDEWKHLEAERTKIKEVIRSVGRIELINHHTYPWVGTGFLVADDVVMTNQHVADVFVKAKGKQWLFTPGVRVQIDYKEEYRQDGAREFKITDVLGIHARHDLALLKVSRKGSGSTKAPKPLAVASQPPKALKDQEVYVVGYPAADGRRNDPEQMMRIFERVFNVKRFQPGKTTGLGKLDGVPTLGHDCSTLGGNSGSCVIDASTHQVVGLHFGGRYLEGNVSVPLWKLTKDPLLKRHPINYA
jgi:V8-like Glu-specific endopeptidase